MLANLDLEMKTQVSVKAHVGPADMKPRSGGQKPKRPRYFTAALAFASD
jgi:hypothetical protein